MEILVTRAQADAERTAARLQVLGHRAVVAPVIRIVATGEPCPAGDWDALIVTSLHASEALATWRGRDVPVFAVGPRTADELRDLGFARIRIADGDAISLAALIRRELPHPASLLHVTARHHKDEPALSLRAAGYGVTLWEAYEAAAAEGLPETARTALAEGRIGAALHYSRRSAELFLSLAEGAGLAGAIDAFPHLCLSDDVAEPLRAMGLTVRIAASPDEPALLRLIDF
jgi:uroporphyrinogen-III synthase